MLSGINSPPRELSSCGTITRPSGLSEFKTLKGHGENHVHSLLMEDGNPLKACVDAALTAMTESGALAAIEAQWLQDATGVPVIE